MVDSPSLEADDIFEAIRNCRFYATQGPSLKVTREGNKIIADTSECTLISFMSNLSFARGKACRGEGLTHAEYEPKEDEKWVRVEVKDAEGLEAWSNIIQI